MGFDIVRTHKNHKHTFLGLRNIPIRSIIDVGANRGQFIRMISNTFPEAQIYSFEPLLVPFQELKKWADQQNERKVSVFNMALGEEEEKEVVIYKHLQHDSSSSFLETMSACEELYPFTKQQSKDIVQMTTLDTIAKQIMLIPEILIKLDVQGYEDRVINGGIETFSKAKACIAETNIDYLYKTQASFKELFLLLDSLGYAYVGNLEQAYAPDGHVVYFDAVFVK